MNNKNFLFFIAVFIFTALAGISQPKYHTIPNYNMKTLDMNNPSVPYYQSIPLYFGAEENCGYNFLQEPEVYGCGSIVGCVSEGYKGQRPVYAHQVVTGKGGQVMFYIVDNFIYNKNGKAFANPDAPGGTGVWTLHEPSVGGLYDPYCMNGDNGYHLYNKIIVVPVPDACNNFYIFYAMLPNEYGNSPALLPRMYVRELTFIDDDNINISPQISLNASGFTAANSACSGFTMDITSFSSEYNDYLLVVEWIDDVKVFRVGPNVDNINTNSKLYQVPRTFAAANCSGVKIPDAVMTYDNFGNVLFIKSARGRVSGVNDAVPAIRYYRFSRNFNAIRFESNETVYNLSYVANGNTYTYRQIAGMECSANRNYLYVTFMELNPIFYFDISGLINGTSIIPQNYTQLSVAGNYRYSELELFANGRIYAVNHHADGDYGAYTAINNPDNPGTTSFTFNSFGTTVLAKRVNLLNPAAAGTYEQWRRKYIFNWQQDNSDYETGYPVSFAEQPNWNNIGAIATWNRGITYNPFLSATGVVYLDEDLVVPSGKTITIYNMTFRFAPGKRFIVSTGSTVVLNNCLMSSLEHCEDQFWQGIRVLGNYNVAQSITTHGRIDVRSGTVIENAERGIESSNGGIIIVNNATIKNNRYGIYFNSYNFDHSLTKISFTRFVTDKIFYKNRISPNSHICLTGNRGRGLIFNGNTFENTVPYDAVVTDYDPAIPSTMIYNVEQRGRGIYSNNSSFVVTQISPTTFQPVSQSYRNNFRGLTYGILVNGTSSVGTVSINWNNFDNNYRGVSLIGSEGASMIYNNFNTTNEVPQVDVENDPVNYAYAPTRFGAFIHGASRFVCEENTFTNGDVGLYVYNTGISAGQKIYRNTIGSLSLSNKMQSGIFIAGKNSDFVYNDPTQIGTLGLEVKCNKFINTDWATYILNGNFRVYQGDLTVNDPKMLAGNQYININLKIHGEFTQVFDPAYNSTTYNPGTYFYIQHNDAMSENNGYFREVRRVTGMTAYTLPLAFREQESCPSNYGATIVSDSIGIDTIPADITSKLSRISKLERKLEEMQNEFTRVVDNGDTEFMRSTAELMNKSNYREAYLELSNNGLLTDEVLTAIIDNKNAPEVAVASLLISNSPLPVDIIKAIKTLSMDNDLEQLVLSYQKDLNSRISMEWAIADVKQEIASVESSVMITALCTEQKSYEREMAIEYFKSKTSSSYQAFIDLFTLYKSNGDKQNAEKVLNDLSVFAKRLNEEQQQEMELFCKINLIEMNAINEYGEIDKDYLMDHKKELWEASINPLFGYDFKARYLFEQISDTVFGHYAPLPKMENVIPNTETKVNSSFVLNPQINVYPNPVAKELNIEYNFANTLDEGYDLLMEATGKTMQDNCNNGYAKVFSMDGKLINTLELNSQLNSINLNVENYPSGVYTIEVTDCYGNSNTVKFNKN